MRNLELEAAIAEAPESVERYRAYATWLENNGDPWGQLIAAQIAAHEEPPRKRKQKAAARKALARYMEECHPGVAFHLPESPYPEENIERVTWRLGFVEAMELRGLNQPLLDQGLAFARSREAALIRRLNVSFTPLAELPDLSQLTYLEQLDLGATGIRDIGPVGGLQRLRFLSIAFTKVSDLAPLARLEALESLSLMETDVTDLTPLHGLQRLRDLILLKTAVGDEQVDALKAAVPTLRRRGRIDR